MSIDLSSTTLWEPQANHDGLSPVLRHQVPAMQAASPKEYNRVFTHRTFRLPLRVHLAFDWIDGDIWDDANAPAYLGIVPRFYQDEEHGYHVTLRRNGKLGASQEAYDYDGMGATNHPARPGDGKRHMLDITFGTDAIDVWLDDTIHHRAAYDESRFSRLKVGRLGLRLDRQHVIFAGVVADEG